MLCCSTTFVPSLTWRKTVQIINAAIDIYSVVQVVCVVFSEDGPRWQRSRRSWRAPLCPDMIQATETSSPGSSSLLSCCPKFWYLQTGTQFNTLQSSCSVLGNISIWLLATCVNCIGFVNHAGCVGAKNSTSVYLPPQCGGRCYRQRSVPLSQRLRWLERSRHGNCNPECTILPRKPFNTQKTIYIWHFTNVTDTICLVNISSP